MPELTIAARTPSPQHGGSFFAHLATPPAGRGPGLLLIQEIFGVNQWLRDVAADLAAAGYAVACPDLFWRQQPRIQLTDQTDAEWKRAFELYNGFDFALAVEDLTATLAALRAHPACTGKAGTVGFCLGGNLVYQMACRSDVDCAVSYYGVGIEGLLGLASGIRNPLLLHIAEQDQFVPPAAQAQIRTALGAHPKVTIHTYPGQDHAFARVGGKHYDGPSADLAHSRTAAFFKRNLGA